MLKRIALVLSVSLIMLSSVWAITVGFDCGPFTTQMEIMEKLSAVPDMVFSKMAAYGLSGNQDFEYVQNVDFGTGTVRALMVCTASTTLERKLEIFTTSNLSATPDASADTDMAFQCAWDADKTQIHYIVKAGAFTSEVASAAMVEFYINTTAANFVEMKASNLGGTLPTRIYSKLYRDNTTGYYYLGTTALFGSSAPESFLVNRAVVGKAVATGVGSSSSAKIGISIQAQSQSTTVSLDTAAIDPNNFSSGVVTGNNPMYLPGVKTNELSVETSNPYIVNDPAVLSVTLGSNQFTPATVASDNATIFDNNL